jgi:hypothetical protein
MRAVKGEGSCDNRREANLTPVAIRISANYSGEIQGVTTITKSLMLRIFIHCPSAISFIESDVHSIARHAADFIPCTGKRDQLVCH